MRSKASQHTDVVITGAGIGATFLALLLGRAGRKVVVLERGKELSTRGAEFLKPRALRLLDEVGLLDRLLERGALKRNVIRYYHDGELLWHYDYADHTALGYYLIVPYKAIIETIIEACTDLPVTMLFDTAISRVESSDHGIDRLVLSDQRVIEAAAYVAADRGELTLPSFISSSGQSNTHEHALYLTTLPSLPSVQMYNRLYFSSNGWLAYLYPVEGVTRLFIAVPQADVSMVGVAPLATRVAAELGSFVSESPDALIVLDAQPALRFHPAPVAARHAMPYHRDNVALLGSAAWSCHPMTGQGMSYTMEDAHVLAQAILDAPDSAVLDDLLDARYEPRQSVHARLIDYGDALARTYPNREEYECAFDPLLHGGDISAARVGDGVVGRSDFQSA